MSLRSELVSQVLALPEKERADLAKQIVASLSFDPLRDEDLGMAWQAEIEDRLAKLDRGESIPRDWRVVMDEIDVDLVKGRTQ